jgi:outer membrane protein assembly factor BamE (lipoprotein component of BamABCDE complex)
MDIKGMLLLVMVFLLAGCTTVGQTLKNDFNARQEYVKNNSELSSEIKDAILDRKVIKGMTKSDVLAVWGKPSRTYLETSGESWFYDQSFFSLCPWKLVSFTSEGKVYNYGEGYGG